MSDETSAEGRAAQALASDCCTADQVQDHDRLALVAKALSDPIRLEMLAVMARGRSCCQLADPISRGVPGADEPQGICVCEFQEQFGLGQSKVSYHLRVLKEAGLMKTETRGKWSFYTIDDEAAAAALDAFGALLKT